MDQALQTRLRRQRRQYLHSRIVESQQEIINIRKERLKSFMEKGKQVSKVLQQEALSLLKPTKYDDIENTLDDEYADMGIEDPRVAVTISKNRSKTIKQFA
jgi:U3 small nucleolar ribonucleoprotein protein IMP4